MDPNKPSERPAWWPDTESWLVSLEERHRGAVPRATVHLYNGDGRLLATIGDVALVAPPAPADEGGTAAAIAAAHRIPEQIVLGGRTWTGTATRVQVAEGFACTIREALQRIYSGAIAEALATWRQGAQRRARQRKRRRHHTARS